VFSKEKLVALAKVLNKPEHKHIFVISDEIYERLIFGDTKHTSFSAIEGS
jgi:aspartate/methionine/tyrosine aminotransferase